MCSMHLSARFYQEAMFVRVCVSSDMKCIVGCVRLMTGGVYHMCIRPVPRNECSTLIV